MRIIILLLLAFHELQAARILGIFTVPSKSHSILGHELFKDLVKSGHEVMKTIESRDDLIFPTIEHRQIKVTVIHPAGNELKNPPVNYTNIILDGELTETFRGFEIVLSCNCTWLLNEFFFTEVMDKMFDDVDVSPALKFKETLNQTVTMTKFVITHHKIQQLLKSNVTFDLVISELALNEALLGKKKTFVDV